MNFEHTDERRMLAQTLDRFVAEQYDFAMRNRIAQSAEGFSIDMWRRFVDLGALGALFGEANGGFGGQGFDIAVAFESLGRGLVVEPLLGALLVGSAIADAGNAAQQPVMASVVNGIAVAALAHDEPGSHYELSQVTTRAIRTKGGWRLEGAKAVVRQGERADLFLVSARTAGDAADADGISLFLVPRDTPGVALRGYALIDGGRAAELTLTAVSLDASALLGQEGEGHGVLEKAVGRGILALCAEALGAMDAARNATLEYLQTRKQFGVPIGSFQALQHRMADLLLEIEQARSAVINASAALQADRVTRERALAAAKFTIGRVGTLVAEESVQMHGGIGMTWELPLAHYAKRLIMINHQLGDDDHHLARYIQLG